MSDDHPHPVTLTDPAGKTDADSTPPASRPVGGPHGVPARVPMWLWIISVGSVVMLLGLAVTVLMTNQPNHGPRSAAEQTTETRGDSEDWMSPEKTFNPHADPSQSVVQYQVDGQGKAVSITYLADNGVLTTLLDVSLPWRMQAHMAASAATAASVTVVGVNDALECRLALDGQEVDHQAGAMVTICSAAKHP